MPAPTTDLLDPKADLVFKMQFAGHPDWLMDLVNAVRSTESPVVDLHVINPEISPEEVKHKLVRLDILAQDSARQVFNLEMQTSRHAGYAERSVFYLARLLSGQLKEGENYRVVKPVVGIHLLDFDLFPEQDQAIWEFELRDRRHSKTVPGRSLQLNMIELPKADRLRSHFPAVLAAWLTYFKHWNEAHIMQQIQHPPVQQAYQNLRALSADRKAWYQQLAREMAAHDEAMLREDAEIRGQATLLLSLLHAKFGEDLPSFIEGRLQVAEAEQLEHWAKRVLTAESLDQVFSDH